MDNSTGHTGYENSLFKRARGIYLYIINNANKECFFCLAMWRKKTTLALSSTLMFLIHSSVGRKCHITFDFLTKGPFISFFKLACEDTNVSFSSFYYL